MDGTHGQLTYCTNIHPGESWKEHATQLQQHIPLIKKQISPGKPFSIGLRLSNTASTQLQDATTLARFKEWLKQNDCYVLIINGFPYGSFHHTVVKDKVHAPDWTTTERVDYTVRLANILANLLPEGMDGGISTSPLTYRHWHAADRLEEVFKRTTFKLLEVVVQLVKLKTETGKTIHIDIEPEPDGLLESGIEFLNWYDEYLLPLGISFLNEHFGWPSDKSEQAIKEHIQLCYDICHFAVGYEDHEDVIKSLRQKNIKVGRIQVSAALKGAMSKNISESKRVADAFSQFNETTYLHQVVALQKDGRLKRYPDLPEALQQANDTQTIEWRSHFHVPLFIESYGVLQSTQQDIIKVLQLHKQQPFTKHLEIETYTWDVLPDALKLPMTESIIREMQWVISLLNENTDTTD